jgi:hypothetical protein
VRIPRRWLLAGAAGLGAALALRLAPAGAHPLSPDSDPLEAPDQQALELRMARIVRLAPVQDAKRRVAAKWLALLPRQPAGEERRRFDMAVEEMAAACALNLMNRDPLHPMIHHTELPPHRVGEVLVPGARYAVDNPDSLYRAIPVDGVSHYAVEGLARAHGPVVNDFSLLTADLRTLASLPGHRLKVGRDRRFTVTVGPEPAGDRPNHLQSSPQAAQLFIRDTLGDWAAERPNLLVVRRVEPAEPAAERADAEIGLEVAGALDRYLQDNLRFIAMATRTPPNQFTQPDFSAENGRLVTQGYSFGHFRLAEDEALVLTVQPGDAPYVVVPLNSLYGTSGDPAGRLASLNNRQADLSPDGSFTVAISLADPGLYNWLDPEGLQEGLVFVRWAGFTGPPATPPAIAARLVRLADLETALPPGMRRVTAAERRDQLAARAAAYAARTRGP